jgi:hypothetical protein
MGLDCSHDAFSGAYGAFNRFRQSIAFVMKGSFPPHFKRNEDFTVIMHNESVMYNTEMDGKHWYWDDKYSEKMYPGIFVLMQHSDCDDNIAPEDCLLIANELEKFLPALQKLKGASGHLERVGGYAAAAERFIKGCRKAFKADENLLFR